LKKFIYKKIFIPIKGHLVQGITPEKLALTVAIGIAVGTFPVIGTSSVICLGLSLLFRLNIALLQVINYAVYPLQFIFLFPFFKTGQFLLGIENVNFSSFSFSEIFSGDFLSALFVIGEALGLSLIGWMIIAFPLAYFSFLLGKILFKKLMVKI
jgi:uncharacterized protein (DUF2062 family)